jgi:hypothetical protein
MTLIQSTATPRRTPWAKRAALASVLAFGAALAVSTVAVSPASAFDHRGHDGGHHGFSHAHYHGGGGGGYWHDGGNGYYGSPGGYYYSPGYYYAPPPVVYGPAAGVTVNTPGFSLGFGIP